MKIEQIEKASVDDLRDELLRLKEREKKLRQENIKKQRRMQTLIMDLGVGLSTAIDKFDVQLGKNSYAENIIKAIINPCAEILLPLIGPTYVLREKFQQPLPLQSSQSIQNENAIYSGPIIHVPTTCPYCKGTKRILLLNSYVECLDCR